MKGWVKTKNAPLKVGQKNFHGHTYLKVTLSYVKLKTVQSPSSKMSMGILSSLDMSLSGLKLLNLDLDTMFLFFFAFDSLFFHSLGRVNNFLYLYMVGVFKLFFLSWLGEKFFFGY